MAANAPENVRRLLAWQKRAAKSEFDLKAEFWRVGSAVCKHQPKRKARPETFAEWHK